MDRSGRAPSDDGADASRADATLADRPSCQTHPQRSLSRRRALAACGTLLTAGTAGCSSLPGSSLLGDSSKSSPEFASWLPAEPILESETPQVTVEAMFDLLDRLPKDHPHAQAVGDLARQYGIGAHQLDRRVRVDVAQDIATVLLGTFTRDFVLSGWEGTGSANGAVGDFTIFGESHAVGPGTIVIASRPELYVETHRGERDLISEVDDAWSSAVQNVAGADLARIASPAGRPYEVIGLSVDVEEGPAYEGTAFVHFTTEAGASQQAGNLAEDVSDLAADGVEATVLGHDVAGTVVEVEVDFDAYPF